MTGSSDFQINSRVRSVLARHMVDLSKLEFSSCRATVRIRGVMMRLGIDADSLSSTAVDGIESEIRAIHGVRRVFFELDNWVKSDAAGWKSTNWANKGKASSLTAGSQAAADARGGAKECS